MRHQAHFSYKSKGEKLDIAKFSAACSVSTIPPKTPSCLGEEGAPTATEWLFLGSPWGCPRQSFSKFWNAQVGQNVRLGLDKFCRSG